MIDATGSNICQRAIQTAHRLSLYIRIIFCHCRLHICLLSLPLTLQRYNKFLEYTSLLLKKSNLFGIFTGKGLLFAQTCDCTFGGFLIYKGVPTVQQIFVCFFTTCASKSAKSFQFSLISISTQYVKDLFAAFIPPAQVIIYRFIACLVSVGGLAEW